MTATAELRMPLGYVSMDEEEMEYLEGGWTSSSKMSLKEARKRLVSAMYTSTAGNIISNLAIPLKGIGADKYFSSVRSQCKKCYNWVEKQRARYKDSKKCKLNAIGYGLFLTSVTVSW